MKKRTETIDGKEHVYYSTDEWERDLEKFLKETQWLFLLSQISPEYREKRKYRKALADNRDLKWALITWYGKNITTLVDKNTMKAYKLVGYSPTYFEYKNYKLRRWARSMDI